METGKLRAMLSSKAKRKLTRWSVELDNATGGYKVGASCDTGGRGREVEEKVSYH